MKSSLCFGWLVSLLPLVSTALLRAEEDPFAFLDGDNKSKPGTPEVAPVKPSGSDVSSEEELLLRWKNFEAAAWSKLETSFVPRRKVAADMLRKKAETAAPAMRPQLLADAQRLQDLPGNKRLEISNTNARDGALQGYWVFNKDKYHRTFYLDGSVTMLDIPGTWHWVDQAAGVLVEHGGGSDLLWLEKDNLLRGVNDSNFTFSMTKSADQKPRFVNDPLITNLAADETSEVKELEAKLSAKRGLLAKYLHQRAGKISDQALAKKLRSKADGLLVKVFDPTDHPELLSGLWTWQAQTLRFAAAGRVVTGNGVPIGVWTWGNGTHKTMMVVLQGGKSAKTIFHANAPTDAADTEVTVRPLTGDKFKATRVLE